MKNGNAAFEDPVNKASDSFSKALDILADSKKRRDNLAFEEKRLSYLLSEYELAKNTGSEEGKKRMRDLEIAIGAVRESLEKLSKPISFEQDEAQG
jgi:hypothetical protein